MEFKEDNSRSSWASGLVKKINAGEADGANGLCTSEVPQDCATAVSQKDSASERTAR